MLGCILMLLGTAIGAGMLALPLTTADFNWQTTVMLMIGCWIIMTGGAFALLEATRWFPPGANFITMSEKLVGSWAKIITWIAYLMLFYSLLCAYLSGTSDILQGLLATVNIHVISSVSTLLALVVLGSVVYQGVHAVDLANRTLMSVKLIIYTILALLISPHISLSKLHAGYYAYHTSAFMIMAASFGFGNIIPTLRDYMHNDISKLRKIIILGSLLSMIIYLIWIGLIQGLVSRSDLMMISHSSQPNSLLMSAVSGILQNHFLECLVKMFISICAVTSFLGVSIGLVDFIADGMQWQKIGWDRIKIYGLSFLPPLIIVLLAPSIFIKALSYSGFCCLFLLVLLPLLMLYRGRMIYGAR